MARAFYTSDAAAERLDRARDWLAAWPRDHEVLVVGHELEAVDAFCRRADAEGARFGWHRLTLELLALRLGQLPLAREGLVPASALARQAICARVLREESASAPLRADGGLDWGAVSGSAGWSRALVRTLDELAGLGDEVTPPAPLDRLARAYGDALVGHGLADRSRLFVAAKAATATDEALTGRPVLWLDVAPPDPVSVALVAALTARSPDVFAVAPAGDRVAIAALTEALGRMPEALETAVDRGALGRIQRGLFRPDVSLESASDEGLHFSSSPGEAREAVEIARRVLRLADEGVALEAMAVLCREPESYRAPLQEAFRRAGVPAYFTGGTERPDPEGRALLALLACRAEQLSASRFAEYLSLGVVPRPDAAATPWVPPDGVALPGDEERTEPDLSDATTIVAPRRWERLIVDAAVIGRDVGRWRRRLGGLADGLRRELNRADDPVEQESLQLRLDDLTSLSDFALPLLERLAALPSAATWEAWLDQLEPLCAEAVARPAGPLAILRELRPLGAIGPVDLDEVRLVLEERLTTLRARPSGGPAGRVYVTGAERARGHRFEVVFLPGLAEKVFPPVVREDPLLLDRARTALHPALPTNTYRVAQERSLLRIAVGAAERQLFLSYPRLDDEKARPRVPSFYALELLRAAEGQLPRFDELPRRDRGSAAARMGWPAPDDPAVAIDDAEYDLATLERLFDADAETRNSAAAYLLHENPHLARALRFRARRWSLKTWGKVDGFATADADLLRRLADQYHPTVRAYSPTTLEHYARCPYRFYLRAVAGLVPRTRPDALDQLDARHRGQLIHAVQSRLFRQLEADGALPLEPAGLDLGLERLDAVLAETTREYVDTLAPAIERVFDDTVAQIRADLRTWLGAVVGDQRHHPVRFELGFGLDVEGRELDPASTPDPIDVGGLVIRGAIDWVEEDGGQLRATDHKTGRFDDARRGIRIMGGKVLQPLLYALALEKQEGEGRVAAGRLYYCTRRGDFQEVVVPLDPPGRQAVAGFIRLLTQSFDEGFFPAQPEPEACTYCDHRVICGPLEDQRRKNKRPLPQLDELRRLP